MREIRMCVVFCLQMKKKSLDFLFGQGSSSMLNSDIIIFNTASCCVHSSHIMLAATLKKKKREKGREKREIFSTRNLFSFTTLISSSLNQLSRTNEGTRNTRRALTKEKEERGPRFRDDARSSRFAVSICSGVYCLGILIKKVLEKRSSFSLL